MLKTNEKLEARRKEFSTRLEQIVEHTQGVIERAQSDDPNLNEAEFIVVIVPNLSSLQKISDAISFEELTKKFHFGSHFKNGWVVRVSDALRLKRQFPDELRFPNHDDILKEVRRIVSAEPWNPANIEAMFKNDD